MTGYVLKYTIRDPFDWMEPDIHRQATIYAEDDQSAFEQAQKILVDAHNKLPGFLIKRYTISGYSLYKESGEYVRSGAGP